MTVIVRSDKLWPGRLKCSLMVLYKYTTIHYTTLYYTTIQYIDNDTYKKKEYVYDMQY